MNQYHPVHYTIKTEEFWSPSADDFLYSCGHVIDDNIPLPILSSLLTMCQYILMTHFYILEVNLLVP